MEGMKYQSRQIDARRLGEPKYRTGKPCKRGHVSERWTQTGTCCQCTLDRCKEHRRLFKLAAENRAAQGL